METKTQKNTLEFMTYSKDMEFVDKMVAQYLWNDVEVICQREMVTAPVFENGWKLIPADQYEYSIPPEALRRVSLLLNAGVRIQGIIIADDVRSRPAKPKTPDIGPIEIDWVTVRKVLRFLGIMAAVLAAVVAIITLAAVIAAIGLGLLVAVALGTALVYDPKLIVLIPDAEGKTIWVCLYTWYESSSD